MTHELREETAEEASTRRLSKIKDWLWSGEYMEDINWLVTRVEQLELDLSSSKALLKRLEWDASALCRVCGNGVIADHAPDCELAALVKRLGG